MYSTSAQIIKIRAFVTFLLFRYKGKCVIILFTIYDCDTKKCSCNVCSLKQNFIVIFTLLNLALEYKGILILTQEQSFPEINNDEKLAVQVQVKFDTNRHIDEFIQFINEIII